MATNTAPPMAAEIYACRDTTHTHGTTACVRRQFITHHSYYPAVLQQRRRNKEQTGFEKNQATKNKSGSKRTSLQRRDPSRREVSRLRLTSLRRRRPRFVILDRARGLLKQRRRRVVRWPDRSKCCGEFWQSPELFFAPRVGIGERGGQGRAGQSRAAACSLRRQ
jgi:hypothetical protein